MISEIKQLEHNSRQENRPRWKAFLDPLPLLSEELALWEEHFKKKRIKTKLVMKETHEGARIELHIYRRWWVGSK